jgi:NADH-quinone oxidoreductase subunit N
MAGINFLVPEILLSIIAMLLLMLGVFKKEDSSSKIFVLSIITLFFVALGVYSNFPSILEKKAIILNGMFVFDRLAVFAKILICVATASVMIISYNSISYAGVNRKVFEFPVLMLLSAVGMFVLVSASDLISMYLGIELMSLALYVLTAMNRDSEVSTEAGIKYFVLGALSSCLILYGASLIYGFAGSTSLEGISEYINNLAGNGQVISSALLVGIVFVIAGICFKLSLVPFHMWAPDVYEGATKAVVAFLSTAPKIAAFVFFARLLNDNLSAIFPSLLQIIAFVAVASMIVGSFAALKQSSFKRLLAYSSIANMGYIMIGLAANSAKGLEASLVYLTIYVVLNIGVFAIISAFNDGEKEFDNLSDLAGLSKTNPYIAFSMAVFMFSLAGIPPLAGFFGKFFVFIAALDKQLYVLAFVGIIASVISAYYYLRVIKIMYFDEKAEGSVSIVTPSINFGLKVLILISVIFNLFLLLDTTSLTNVSALAASSLF